MNRNVESHFSTTPEIDIQRSTFEIPFTHKTTFNVGDLVPFYCSEVLAGDTFRLTTSKVVRLQTLLNPIFDSIYLDSYYFFVPNRLVWDHWVNFFGESDRAWLPSTEYQIPFLKLAESKVLPLGSIPDYFGWPVGKHAVEGSALPIRGYHLIWNDFFRDTSVQDPLNIYTGDSDKTFLADDATDNLSEQFLWPRKAARYHDYFSSVLPSPQRGPEATIPLGNFAPVRTGTDNELGPQARLVRNGDFMLFSKWDSTQQKWVDATAGTLGVDADGKLREVSGTVAATNPAVLPTNLVTDLSYASSASINDLRLAFQIQRMWEKDALFGDRYISILKGHFGVSNGDARLQRPEYLGGNRIALNIHEVVNQSEGEQAFLGNLGAMSHTADVHEDLVKSFSEPGYVIGVMVARYDNSYSQGMERFWSRRSRFDFYWPSLAHLGNMAVKNKEIYWKDDPGTNNDEVFGYQEAWADYRYAKNLCSCEMRPGVSGSLASWHLGDYYTDTPAFSGAWLETNPDIVDRVLAVSHFEAKQIFCDIFVRNIATRPMPLYSVPGLIDHL